MPSYCKLRDGYINRVIVYCTLPQILNITYGTVNYSQRGEKKMPVEGFETITVSSETYQALKSIAEKTQRSIPKTIEHLLRTHAEA